MTRHPWAALLFATISGVSANALAQARGQEVSADSRTVAEMLFFTARGLMEAGRVADACVKLAESYRLDPADGTLLNLAVCHEKEGKIATAWGDFREALANARRASRADREALAREHIAALEPDLPYLNIIVPDAIKVKGLQVVRNGTPMNEATWGTEIPVDPGTVEIIERASLYKDKTKTIDIAKREHLSITLDPLELAPVYLPPPPFWTVRREVGMAMLGVGVAGVVAGAITGELAISAKSSSDSNCPTQMTQLRCTQIGVNDMNNAKLYAALSDTTFAIGAIGIVSGTVLMALKTRQEGPVAPAPATPPPTAWLNPASWSWDVAPTLRGTQAVIGHSF